jgi:crossover junction endodeoxyribonuclease RuvC
MAPPPGHSSPPETGDRPRAPRARASGPAAPARIARPAGLGTHHPAPVVLGIDPGTAILGYAVVAEEAGGALRLIDHGVITTSPKDDLGQRLRTLYQGVAEVVARSAPSEVAVEKLFFSRNVTSALAVGQARGVAILAATQCGLAVHEYTPAEIKQAVAHYGGARKEQIQEMVRILLRLPSQLQPDDAADAAAVAICHAHTRSTRARLALLGAGR